MNDGALRAALKKLLAVGEGASDSAMKARFAKKNAPPAPAEAMCPECKVALVDGACPECGYTAPAEEDGEGEMADLLAAGSEE